MHVFFASGCSISCVTSPENILSLFLLSTSEVPYYTNILACMSAFRLLVPRRRIKITSGLQKNEGTYKYGTKQGHNK